MKGLLVGILALSAFLWTNESSAQCVDCISFDTCVPAGANGWLRCRFGNNYCIATGFCSGAHPAAASAAAELRGTPARVSASLIQPVSVSQIVKRSRSVLDFDRCPDVATDFTTDHATRKVAWGNVATVQLLADPGTLIQLAQVDAVAAHVALALADRRGWDISELTAGVARLPAYSPNQILQLVSGQPMISDGAVESTAAIFLEGKPTSASTFKLRVSGIDMREVVLVYRRVVDSSNYKLSTWE